MVNRVILIGCSKSKRARRAPVRDLYTGQLFRLSLRYAEPRAEHVFVVSALHGLLGLDEQIDPYDWTMKNVTAGMAKQRWAAHVLATLLLSAGKPTSLELLLAEPYIAPLRPLLADLEQRSASGLLEGVAAWPRASCPLQGLGFGERKRWLKAHDDPRWTSTDPAAPAVRPASSGSTPAAG